MQPARTILIWVILALSLSVPIVAASFSPLLQYRQPVYITAGFAGIAGLGLLLFQPLLAGNDLLQLSLRKARRLHRIVGSVIVLLVLVHVVGLWIFSPPDVIDALLFKSPTPFSLWGVIAMWAIFATACFAAFRLRLRVNPQHWRYGHMALAIVIASSTIAHALLIDGTMELISKIVLCALVAAATANMAWHVFGHRR